MVNLNLSRYFRPCCLQRYTDMQCTYKGLSLKYTLSGRKTKRILSIWALNSNVTTFRHIMHGRYTTNATTCPLTASWPIKPLNFRPNHTSPIIAICNNQKNSRFMWPKSVAMLLIFHFDKVRHHQP